MVVLGREREDLDPSVSGLVTAGWKNVSWGGKKKKKDRKPWYLLVFEMLMEIMEAEFL